MADLEVYSPIDGQIVTWDLKNRLEGRPVQRGPALLRVANPEGDWELDLHMPEDRMGHIARARNAADAAQGAAAGHLYPGHGAGNDAQGDRQGDQADGRSPRRRTKATWW